MTAQSFLMFIVKLLAGTGVFLVGVHLLTENIEQLATTKIKSLFNQTANKKLVNVGIGAATTAIIQSSGVTTVLIVGFVNVGIMNLYQATAMIMGANIGTTITAQIAALSAFPITTYVQALTFIGIMMTMVCKKSNTQKIGFVVAGLGLVFIGLSLMSDSMEVNRDAIQSVFEVVQNPFLLFFIGIFLTALVQSSSATTSIIIAMAVAGLTIGTGGNEVLYIILGTNIGSCVTALMSSLNAGANAKRASLIHLMFNVFGSVIFFIMLLCWKDFMQVTFAKWFASPATQIAMFHTFFNTVCTILFLPFSGVFVKLSQLLISDKKKTKSEQTYLDDRILSSPSLAISQIEKETVVLSDTAMDAFRMSYKSFVDRDVGAIDAIHEKIDRAGEVAQEIINYLIRLSSMQSNLSEEKSISDIHSNIGDIMRIAEISDNITKYTQREVKKNLTFSKKVREDIGEMANRIEDLYGYTKQLILEKDISLLKEVDSAEEDIDAFRKRLIDSHIERLNAGECTPESSSVFINLISNLERLGDHLTYIAHTVEEEQ